MRTLNAQPPSPSSWPLRASFRGLSVLWVALRCPGRARSNQILRIGPDPPTRVFKRNGVSDRARLPLGQTRDALVSEECRTTTSSRQGHGAWKRVSGALRCKSRS